MFLNQVSDSLSRQQLYNSIDLPQQQLWYQQARQVGVQAENVNTGALALFRTKMMISAPSAHAEVPKLKDDETAASKPSDGETDTDLSTPKEKKKLGDRRTNLFVNGVECKKVPFDEVEPDQHVRDLIAMKVRDDDVLVAAYPKCGTHWMWEIVQMLVNKTTAHEVRTKEFAMLELVPVSQVDEQKSPRILNSHLYFAHLPEEFVTKKTKIIHVVRNPKDTLVSMFYHYSRSIEMTWEDLIEEIISKAGNIKDQFDYLQQMTAFQQEHPDHPVMLVYYEALKKNPVPIIKEMSEFLEVPASEEMCQEVASLCSFSNLKQANQQKDPPAHLNESRALNDRMYRKGIIGDWKNEFTVAQNERFEAFVKQELGDLPFTFTYM